MATKIPSQKKKTKQYKRGIDWISKQVELEVLFTVKGTGGLWMPLTKPLKNGILLMERFGTGEKKHIKKSLLSGIGTTSIPMNRQAVLPLGEAFDNLQRYWRNSTVIEAVAKDDQEVIEMKRVICPDFDPDGFKSYHAKKVIIWYNELIEGIRNASN